MGDLVVLEDLFIIMSGCEVILKIFGLLDNIKKSDYVMNCLKVVMKWDEECFGFEYDFDIYFLLIVDFFNMGVMENKGLNIFNFKFVLVNEKIVIDIDYFGIEVVIGYEYFYNWMGNCVICCDWF